MLLQASQRQGMETDFKPVRDIALCEQHARQKKADAG